MYGEKEKRKHHFIPWILWAPVREGLGSMIPLLLVASTEVTQWCSSSRWAGPGFPKRFHFLSDVWAMAGNFNLIETKGCCLTHGLFIMMDSKLLVFLTQWASTRTNILREEEGSCLSFYDFALKIIQRHFYYTVYFWFREEDINSQPTNGISIKNMQTFKKLPYNLIVTYCHLTPLFNLFFL